MATRILPLPRPAWFDGNGHPLEGGKVHTYEPGTTTEKPTYQDIGQSVAHANPITLNARGEPNSAIYWDGEYKVVVKDSAGTTIYTQDNYGDAEDPTSPGGANLLINGDFEIDLDGDDAPDSWTLTISSGNTVAIDTTNVKSGVNSLKFTTTDGTKAGTATSDLVPFVAGEVLYFRGWTVSNVTDLTNEVIVDWYSDTVTVISSDTLYDDSGTSVTSLTEISDTATAPATTKYFKIRIEGADGDGTELGATWFDAFRVERTAENASSLGGVAASEVFFTGEVRMCALSTEPGGWLFCTGQAVSRTTYAALFTAIGTTWGVGDGSTTFNVPDIRGRAPIGVGTGTGLTERELADEVGAETHTLTEAEMPSHRHDISTVTAEEVESIAGGEFITGYASADTGPTDADSTAIQITGSDNAHNNMQPSLALNFIIKT